MLELLTHVRVRAGRSHCTDELLAHDVLATIVVAEIGRNGARLPRIGKSGLQAALANHLARREATSEREPMPTASSAAPALRQPSTI